MLRIPVRDPVLQRPSRWSSPPGGHFLTLCTSRQNPGLATPQFNSEFYAATHLLVLENLWQVRTTIVMPHHAHLLVSLSEPADLPVVVEIFKERLASCLQRAGLQWQRGYCARRMHPGEDHLPTFLYIFRNPYRARLLAPNETWSGYYCDENDWAWFAPLTRTACQFPEWLPHWRLYAVGQSPD